MLNLVRIRLGFFFNQKRQHNSDPLEEHVSRHCVRYTVGGFRASGIHHNKKMLIICLKMTFPDPPELREVLAKEDYDGRVRPAGLGARAAEIGLLPRHMRMPKPG